MSETPSSSSLSSKGVNKGSYLVPAIVLSSLKDQRYTSRLAHFIHELIEAQNIDGDDAQQQQVSKSALFYASVLYSTLTLIRSFNYSRYIQTSPQHQQRISSGHSNVQDQRKKNKIGKSAMWSTLGMEHVGVVMGPSSFLLQFVISCILSQVSLSLCSPPALQETATSARSESNENNIQRERDAQHISALEGLRGNSRRMVFFEQRRKIKDRAAALERYPQSESSLSPLQREPDEGQNLRDIPSLVDHNHNTGRIDNESIRLRLNHALIYLRQKLSVGATHRRIILGLRWLIRLHLALYFLNGKFDRISNRVRNVTYRKRSHKNEKTAILNDVDIAQDSEVTHPSYDVVGYLILVEAICSLFSYTSDKSVEICLKIQDVTRKLCQRIRLIAKRSSTLNNSQSCQPNQTLVEEVNSKVPCMDIPLESSDFLINQTKICTICRGLRKNPAITPCGHVFCWECIIRHTLGSQKECPLCRSVCLPQNIRCLQNYH